MSENHLIPIEHRENLNVPAGYAPVFDGLQSYFNAIRKYPILEKDEEFALARRLIENQDMKAAHILVTSHLRLAAATALKYRRYNLSLAELVAEANIGLMQAVKRFDPEKGFRLSTYALWWIRAAIQEYILRSWSVVKIASTGAQKKLFFNLQKIKRDLEAYEIGDLHPENVEKIALTLGVAKKDVIEMNRRLIGGDSSLNAPVGNDPDEQNGERLDKVPSEMLSQEEIYAEREEADLRKKWLLEALKILNPREKEIFTARRLSDHIISLDELAENFGVSRERVRQIEARAFEKVRDFISERAVAGGEAPLSKALPAPPVRGRISFQKNRALPAPQNH